MNIDKQRITAVRQLEALGYRFEGDEWVPASPPAVAGPRSLMTAECDVMHGVLVAAGHDRHARIVSHFRSRPSP